MEKHFGNAESVNAQLALGNLGGTENLDGFETPANLKAGARRARDSTRSSQTLGNVESHLLRAEIAHLHEEVERLREITRQLKHDKEQAVNCAILSERREMFLSETVKSMRKEKESAEKIRRLESELKRYIVNQDSKGDSGGDSKTSDAESKTSKEDEVVPEVARNLYTRGVSLSLSLEDHLRVARLTRGNSSVRYSGNTHEAKERQITALQQRIIELNRAHRGPERRNERAGAREHKLANGFCAGYRRAASFHRALPDRETLYRYRCAE